MKVAVAATPALVAVNVQVVSALSGGSAVIDPLAATRPTPWSISTVLAYATFQLSHFVLVRRSMLLWDCSPSGLSLVRPLALYALTQVRLSGLPARRNWNSLTWTRLWSWPRNLIGTNRKCR